MKKGESGSIIPAARIEQSIISHKELNKDVEGLKRFILKNSLANDREFKKIWQAFEKLSTPHQEKKQRKIGFDLS